MEGDRIWYKGVRLTFKIYLFSLYIYCLYKLFIKLFKYIDVPKPSTKIETAPNNIREMYAPIVAETATLIFIFIYFHHNH